jgi:hypothetical protein
MSEKNQVRWRMTLAAAAVMKALAACGGGAQVIPAGEGSRSWEAAPIF